jgi:hypothetical protein
LERYCSIIHLLHWQDQLRLYDKIVAPTEPLLDTTKKVLLETAVHPIEMLCAVKIQADQTKVTSSHTLRYDEYSRLFLSAATNYDSAFLNRTSKSVASGCCTAYNHELQIDSTTEEFDTHYGIDIGIDSIQANVNEMQPQQHISKGIAFSQWKQMSKEAQGI